MGKRSDFERRPRDAYATPYEAVVPLLAHLPRFTRYDEPCCGEGELVRHLGQHGHLCASMSDIETPLTTAVVRDALTIEACVGACFITNPPWDRRILHPLIERLSAIAPAWLLFDADWQHTKQAAPYLPWCHKVVSVGRVKWIPGSKMTGKDNCAWYLFDQTAQRLTAGPVLFGRTA